MKSFLNPANPLLFDVEGHYQQTAWNHTPKFMPVWSTGDIVYSRFPEPAGAGTLMSVYGTSEFDPYARKSTLTPVFDFTDPEKTYGIVPTGLEGNIRFQYNHPDGNVYTTPTYFATSDECVLQRTLKIRYWNNTSMLGGSEYPDVTYAGSYKPFIRVYGSLDPDGTNGDRSFFTNGLGESFSCRTSMQTAFRLTVGPHPAWVHRKLQYIFMHQNIEISKHGSNDYILLTPETSYEQTQQVTESFNLFIGSGRLVSSVHGLVSV